LKAIENNPALRNKLEEMTRESDVSQHPAMLRELRPDDCLEGYPKAIILPFQERARLTGKMISEISKLSCNYLQRLRMPTVLCYVLCLTFAGGFESHSLRQFF